MLTAAVLGALPVAQALAQPLQPDAGEAREGSATTRVDVPGAMVRALLATPENGSLSIPGWFVAPGQRRRVTLQRHDVYSPGARIIVVTAKGTVEVARSSRLVYWGAVSGDPSIRVAASVDPAGEDLRALTVSPRGAYRLARADGNSGGYILADARAEARARGGEPRWTCGEEGLAEPLPPEATLLALGNVHAQALTSLHTATVAIDTDTELMSQKFGNDTTAATDYLADLFAAMNVIYERDLNIRLLQGDTFLRVGTDPYSQPPDASGAASPTQLNEFRTYWINNYGGVNRALAAMLSGKSPSNYSSAGIGYLDTLCNGSYGYSFTQVFKINYLAGDVMVVAHELGHNFGSPHTHCYVPTIDTCFSGEAGCYSGTTSCPAGGAGTLMSYCHLLSGCSSTPVFHSRVVSLIDSCTAPEIGVCIFPAETPDTTPPVVSATGVTPGSGLPGQSFTISTHVVDSESAVASVAADVRAPGGTVVGSVTLAPAGSDTYTGIFTSTALPFGTYTIDVRATDTSPQANQATVTAAASFELVVPPECDVTVAGTAVNDTREVEACYSITAGPDLLIDTTGSLTLRAASVVVLRNGTKVASGGLLIVALDPALAR